MIGSFRRRNCKCKKKRCTCGSKWTYRYHIVDPKTGKRKQKETRGFDTKEEAEAEAKRILVELQNGTYIEEKDITFQDFASQWLDLYSKSGRVKQSTIDIRKEKLKILEDHFAQIKMKDITRLMYQEFLNSLQEKYARKTIASIHEVGSLIFKKAVELEIIAKNIIEYAEIPTKKLTVEELEGQIKVPRYLEKEELKQFLEAAKLSNRATDYPMFVTLAYTGLRVGELCALKWKDIDFSEQTISITKTLYNKNNKSGEHALHTPKTKSSIRTLDVDEIVLTALEQHKKSQKVVSLEDRKNDFVFVDRQGNPVSTAYVQKRMRSLLKHAKIDLHLTPHSLRHTHTSLLAEAGVSLEVIQNRLGHQDEKITRAIYLHITKPKRKEASQKFSELMRGI
ncbi:Site-specific recombinase XerD [Paenibacillus tianmuensis]|uniref:Site-specific recombinase XerD n=1 Tax=Paenibacillus tianmuensis TaxID=624147 RepID=A0A1G4Q965_9BACL|nr:tyrosine-type recombinase/integrase [Paenibacillus tianmuensis]SCW41130.1 Site-specific recombinase XerD [Paenibacillus tianmuensis]